MTIQDELPSMDEGCKVDAAIATYDLDADGTSMDSELLSRWLGTAGHQSVGYRRLTEWFNRRLLKRAYDVNGRETIGARVESEYDILTGDDDLTRQELVDELKADSIDGRSLRKEMVSWSTMRHHLNDCLGAEKSTPQATTEWERNSVDIARERLIEKVQSAVKSLESKGKLSGGARADVTVQVFVTCPDCSVRVPLAEALAREYICRTHLTPDDINTDTA